VVPLNGAFRTGAVPIDVRAPTRPQGAASAPAVSQQ